MILFLSFFQPTVHANNLSEKSSLTRATSPGIGTQNLLEEIPPLAPEEPHRKVAFITGVTRGIGRAVAELFLENGIHVIGVARDAVALQAFYTNNLLKNSISRRRGELKTIVADLSTDAGQDSVALAVARYLGENGKLDLVLLNAGVIKPLGPKAIFTASADEIRRCLRTNLESAVVLTGALYPFYNKKNEGTRIMYVSSIAGERPGGGTAFYSTTKAGLDQWVRAMLKDAPGGDKVSFAGVNPGNVETDIHSKDLRGEDPLNFPRATFFNQMKGKLMSAEKAAEYIVWLLNTAPKEEFLKYPKHNIYNSEQQKLWSTEPVLDPYPATQTIPVSKSSALRSP